MEHREPTKFDDWHAINTLLMTYAEHVDAGRYADVGAMFEHASYRIEHADGEHASTYEGTAQVQAFCEQTRIYPDGTPRTKHVITNVIIDVDGDRARAQSYGTVLQQTDVFPLQPIASGRYVDRFERIEGTWRFVERVLSGFLLGDRSHHIVWAGGTPEAPGS
jgi:3-phenylpropionate/cinnamic acid dioxygenase small subunit